VSDFTVVTNIAHARKPHRCHWCGERIEIGNPYVRVFGSWDGDVGHSCWHPECDGAFQSLTWKQKEDRGLDESFDAGLFKRGSIEARRD